MSYRSFFLVMIWFLTFSTSISAERESGQKVGPVKAGFVYVGPIGDHGWTNAHERARKELMKEFCWLKSTYVESVPEADSARVIDNLIQNEKCDVVFTTSFGYMNPTFNAAKMYPNKKFMQCSGHQRSENMGTYFAELYQTYYLNGLMAGALSKSNKVGYVGAQPIPAIIRHINAFALGVKEVNPKAQIHVKWLFSWHDPAKAKEAAEALVAEGCDALAFTEDSPAVVQVGQEHTKKGKQVYTFSHYSAMQEFGEDSCVSGQLVDWKVLYQDILLRIHSGIWKPDDYWYLMEEKAAILGGKPGEEINPKFEGALKEKSVEDPILEKINVWDLVHRRKAQMSEPTVLFEPFTGPILDQKGALRLKPNQRADHKTLWEMDWFIDNVVGEIPR